MKNCFYIYIFLTISVLFAGNGVFGQQMPQYSQYVFNTLHVNPGYAGYKVDPFVQATYRSQFMDFPGAPKTFSVSADMGLLDQSMGFGVALISDQLGPTKINSAMLTYAYKIEVKRDGYLAMGISAGAAEYILDGEVLRPDDPTDPGITDGRLNMFIPNLNAGLFYHTPKFFTGLSVFNLIGQNMLKNQDLALANHNYHFYFQMGAIFPLSNEVSLKPSILVREDLNAPTSFDINTMFLFKELFWVGTSFRSGISKNNTPEMANLNNRNAIVLLFDLFVTDDIRVGYAYDMNINKKNNYRNNSHELSVGYYINDKWIKTPRQPRF
ncbi:MAG: type IX secretion system membrane protein PorP/SprF [Cyclobacteriaceae bacterium]